MFFFNRAVKSPLLVIDERSLFSWAFNPSSPQPVAKQAKAGKNSTKISYKP
jgi:hypothetical protein